MARKYALLGKEILESLSPDIYSILSDIFKVELEYSILDSENIAIAKKYLFSGEYDGFNVTMPYKVDLINQVDYIDESAKICGSTNMLFVKNGKIEAYNTDGKGFLDVLNLNGYDVREKRVLLNGAGGAARSIAVELLKAGVKNIIFDTRTTETRIAFYEMINSIDSDRVAMVYGVNGIIVDLVINTTPVGSLSNPDLSINLQSISCDAVFDIVYRPIETPLLKMAKELNKNVFYGLDMLICQAVRSFSIWYPDLKIDFTDKSLTDKIKERLTYPEER